jgi:hypothetical protein
VYVIDIDNKKDILALRYFFAVYNLAGKEIYV